MSGYGLGSKRGEMESEIMREAKSFKVERDLGFFV